MSSKAERERIKSPIRVICHAARAVLSVLVVIAALFAVAETASAYEGPYTLIIYTDKQVYLDDARMSDNTYYGRNDNDVVFETYAVVLDKDGNIVRSGVSFTGQYRDVANLTHPGTSTHHVENRRTGIWYNNLSLSGFTQIGTTGIFKSFTNPTDYSQLTPQPSNPSDHIEILINVTATIGGTQLQANTTVLFSKAFCKAGHSKAGFAGAEHGNSQHDGVPCTACHWGVEHQLGVHGDDGILAQDISKVDRSIGMDSGWFVYNLGYNINTTANTVDKFSTFKSATCLLCHGPSSGFDNSNILDMGWNGDTPTPSDQNGDGITDTRPSCSWPQGVNSSAPNPECHAATNITESSLTGIDWKWKQNRAGNSTSHNHTTNKANVSCEICHGNHNVTGLPNRTATGSDYLNINKQCVLCHNITGGWLNITANGPPNITHTNPDCAACHQDFSVKKMDSHLVGTAGIPNANCTECHDLGGKAPYYVDISIMNNSDYVHNKSNASENPPKRPLNWNASKPAGVREENKMCWACHGNINATSKLANFSDQPTNDHPANYKKAKTCEDCHQNVSKPFGAPQNVAHSLNNSAGVLTPGAPDCYDCHGQPANYNTSNNDPDYNNTNASRAAKALKATFAYHYGTGFPALEHLRGTEGYCIKYCHQNTSSPFKAEFYNTGNMQRPNHSAMTSRLENQSCIAKQCHAAEELHGTKMRKPTFASGAFNNSACVESGCHNKSDPDYIDYKSHNAANASGGVNCTSCHMDNKGENIHPIKYLQNDGVDFAQVNITAATCKLCHKNSQADNVTKRWGVSPRKVGSQHHSEDPLNGSKWNQTLTPFWDYNPSGITYVTGWKNTSTEGRGYISNFEAMQDANYSAARISEDTNSYSYLGSHPVNHWLNSTANSTGWVNYKAATIGTTNLGWDQNIGNPPGSITVATTTTKTQSGSVDAWWNASFTYPKSLQVAEATIGIDSKLILAKGVSNGLINVIIDDSSNITEVYNRSFSTLEPDWIEGSKSIFNPDTVFWKNGVYNVSIRTRYTAATSSNIKVSYDNVFVNISEVDYKKYNFTFYINNTPNTDNRYTLYVGYQTHTEPASLYVLNGSSFDYKTDLSSGAFTKAIVPLSQQEYGNGNVTLRINDTNNGVDVHPDYIDIEYMFIESYQWINNSRVQYPCEYCHASNKHYEHALGIPYAFKGNNYVGQEVNATTNWCASCHYQGYYSGGKNYNDMVQAFTSSKLAVPPEITGHSIYGVNYTNSPDYYEHATLDSFNDSKCFDCHKGGLTAGADSTTFIHNVSKGTAGGRNCTACHSENAPSTYKRVNFTSINKSMHANLNRNATGGNVTNKPCWACHGTKNGTWANETDQPLDSHNTTIYNKPRKCQDCHNGTTPLFNAMIVTDHIPSGINTSTDVDTSSYNYTYCSYCHNNSVGISFDPDGMGVTGSSPTNASSAHYGANKTAGKLMYNSSGNSEDCIYCHRNSSNMVKWGIRQGSRANISNKNASGGGTSHDLYTSSGDCSQCHGGYVVTGSFTFHNSALGPGAGGGPDCKNCHDIGASGSSLNVNFSVMNGTNAIHRNLNSNATASVNAENRKCWACHGNGEESTGHHTSLYACLDCHNRTNNLTFTTNTTIKTELNKKKVSEHIQLTYENITSTRNNTAVNCTYCHNKSLLGFTDTASLNINSNVSHYADKSALVSSTTNCSFCHKNAANASKYYANITRHPARTQEFSYCRNCHNNTNASSLHSQSLEFQFGAKASIHGGTTGTANYWGFDWEGDDWKEANVARNDEGCQACHKSGQPPRICENCHLPDNNSLFLGPRKDTGLVLNASINNSIPRVYSHTNYSSVNVPNQSQGGISGCYGFGNMTCHGVDYYNKSNAGGYFAYNYMYASSVWKSDPSHFTNTIDRLPDTANCLFCHNQTNTTVRRAWGNAIQVNASNMYGAVTNADCYNCHTADKSAPDDFHASTILKGSSGGRNCTECHNIGGSVTGKLVNFTSINKSMHANLNRNATSTPGNITNKPCWGCHGTLNGSYANETDQNETSHNITYYKNPRKCPDCHNATSAKYNARSVIDHIPSGLYPGTDVNTSSYNYTYCSYCHNNSVSASYDPDGMGLTTGGNPRNASVSHYGANRTKGLLMSAANNSTDCVYCHKNSSNMLKWGILQGSLANITNKNGTANTGFNHTSYSQSSSQCYQCHGGTVDNFHVSAMSPGEKGNPNCASCHNVSSPGSYAKVDFIAINISVHGNLNNKSTSTAGNETNKPCWGCHGTKNGTYANQSDQPANDHNSTYKSTPRKCEDCHINGSIQFSAPGLTEHIMPGNNASTEINVTEGYCAVCHNNSITSNSDNDGMGILSVINASTAHYAKDANANLMTTVQHSDNCTYCHFVSNGSSAWLTPRKPLTSTHTSYNNGTSPDICWGCHVDFQGEPSTFHVQAINKGAGSGPNCRSCHNTSDSGTTKGHIDGNVFNTSIHGNMNTTGGVDLNEPCWGCHGDGNQPSSHPANYKNPYNCTDCHLSEGTRNSWAVARGALNVTEHFTTATDIKASYNATALYSCMKCHQDIREMKLNNSDNDYNITAWASGGDNYNATIGGNNSPYHYGRKRSDIRNGTSTNCTYCHQNSSTAFTSAMQNPIVNKSIYEHTDNGTRNVTGRACTDSGCHNAGFIHNSTLTKPAVSNWTQGKYDYCAPCHRESGISSKKVRGHNTSNISTPGMDCGYCHNASSQGQAGGALRVHSTRLANRSTTNSTCETCHRDATYVPASRIIKTHYPNATTDKGNTSESGRTCELCHGISGANKLHQSTVKKPNYNCESCHLNGNKTSPYNATTAKASINSFLHDNASHALGNQTGCERCHNTTNKSETFHFTDYANGTSVAPGWTGWNNGTQANCIDCHRNKTNQAPFFALFSTSSTHTNATIDGCYNCHTDASTRASNPRALHYVLTSPGSANCTLCHDLAGEAGKKIDVAAMNKSDSIHLNLNKNATVVKASPSYAGDSKRCWACHGNGSEPNGHPTNFKNAYKCVDCHVISGSRNTNYTPNNTIFTVTEHYRGGSEIRTPAAAYCTDCHNKTEMLKAGNDAALSTANPANDSVSHYGRKRADVRSGASADCGYCHQNSSTVFENVMLSSLNKSIIEHTNGTGAKNTSAGDCTGSKCHSSGFIHNSTLTRPTVQSFTAGSKDYCAPCHIVNNNNATKYVYAHNTSNISIVSMDCGYCHNASSQGIKSSGALKLHTSVLTNTSTSNSTCDKCHRDSKYVGISRLINTHYPGASAGKANTSKSVSGCENCHGWSAGTKMHNKSLIKKPNYDCNACHNASGTSPYKANATPFVNLTRHDNASHNASNTINCNWCHNNTNRQEPFHFTNWSNGTVEAPGWGGWTNGTRVNCKDCHITYANQWPFYAEPNSTPNWHKGNYGGSLDDCYQCHSNLTVLSAGDNKAPVQMHNVTRAIDWGNCNACHAPKYGGAPKVDNTSLSALNSMHAGIDGTTSSNINPACKACHGGNAGIHKNSSANNCTYCHIAGKLKYTTKNVSEHIINGTYANTTVNTSRYQQVFCDLCHNNSLASFNDDSPGTKNATTAHYGQNKSAGKLMSGSSNTTDCLFCHKNSSNMVKWGVNSTSYANISNRGDHKDHSTNAVCYDCHTDSKARPLTFHAEELNQGAGSSPNCLGCHDTGSSNRKVDFTITNSSNNIHRNLNSGASAGSYASANKPCWACHGNGTATAHIDGIYKAPRICESCHINASLPYNAPQVREHYRNGSDIKATNATNNTRSCLACHQNISEMLIQNNDPDAGTFDADKDGVNGTNISAYHYGRKRSELRSGVNTSCGYCHQNSSTAFGNVMTNSLNKSIYEHTNGTANITNATLTCTGGNCHASGFIHNSTLTKPAVQNWTQGSKDYCAPCHKPGNASAAKYVYNQRHDPANSTSDRIGDCGYCHNASSQGINGGTLRVHTPALTNTTSPVNYGNCSGCHNGTSLYIGAGKQILSHMPNTSQYRGNTSTSSYDCKDCHNLSGKPSMHSIGMNRSNGTCDTCHFSRTSPYKANKKIIAANDYNHTYVGQKTCAIAQCHNASNGSVFHMDKYAAGVVAEPEKFNLVWNDRNNAGKGFTDTPHLDCIDCHREHNNSYPFNNTYPFNYSKNESYGYEANRTGQNKKIHLASDSMDSCYNCHTNRSDSKDRYMVHNVTIEPLEGGAACIKCHNLSAPTTGGYPPATMKTNHTAFNQSVHTKLTNYTVWNDSKKPDSTLLDSACWACHATNIADIPNNAHPDRGGPASMRPFQCEECHISGGNVSIYNKPVYDNATKIYKHYPGALFGGLKFFNSTKACFECHRNSFVGNINTSYGTGYLYKNEANLSHYAARSGLLITNQTQNGCKECHMPGTGNEQVPKDYGNAGIMPASHNNMGVSPTNCQKSCHNTNPGFNVTLHDSKVGVYLGTNSCYSSGCHSLPSSGGRRRR